MSKSYKWTDYRSEGVAKRLGKYPYQFVFSQDSDVFHHNMVQKRHTDFDCVSVTDCDSDMTFSAALKAAFDESDMDPCPVCLAEFPTSRDELRRNHFPDKSSISYEEVMNGNVF